MSKKKIKQNEKKNAIWHIIRTHTYTHICIFEYNQIRLKNLKINMFVLNQISMAIPVAGLPPGRYNSSIERVLKCPSFLSLLLGLLAGTAVTPFQIFFVFFIFFFYF